MVICPWPHKFRLKQRERRQLSSVNSVSSPVVVKFDVSVNGMQQLHRDIQGGGCLSDTWIEMETTGLVRGDGFPHMMKLSAPVGRAGCASMHMWACESS